MNVKKLTTWRISWKIHLPSSTQRLRAAEITSMKCVVNKAAIACFLMKEVPEVIRNNWLLLLASSNFLRTTHNWLWLEETEGSILYSSTDLTLIYCLLFILWLIFKKYLNRNSLYFMFSSVTIVCCILGTLDSEKFEDCCLDYWMGLFESIKIENIFNHLFKLGFCFDK